MPYCDRASVSYFDTKVHLAWQTVHLGIAVAWSFEAAYLEVFVSRLGQREISDNVCMHLQHEFRMTRKEIG